MTKMIYVAGPLYGSGLAGPNIRKALEAGVALRHMGYLPFIPHLYFFWDQVHPAAEDYWLDLDKDWVERSDALVRLPGASPGAGKEEAWAAQANIPIVIMHESDSYTAVHMKIQDTLRAEAEAKAKPIKPPLGVPLELELEYRWREVYGIDLRKLSAFTGYTMERLDEILSEALPGIKAVEQRNHG
jgi:hypothetical protein